MRFVQFLFFRHALAHFGEVCYNYIDVFGDIKVLSPCWQLEYSTVIAPLSITKKEELYAKQKASVRNSSR